MKPTSYVPAILAVCALVVALPAIGQEPVITEQFYSTSSDLRGIHFVDTMVGWAVGGGLVLATTNGGDTWSPVSGLADAYFGVAFRDDQIGLIVGAPGVIKRTTDGGGSWGSVSSGTTQTLRAVAWGTGGVVYVVGDGGVVLRSLDDGASWTEIRADGTDLVDVWAVGPDRAWAVGESRYVRVTHNGGDSWLLRDCGNSVSVLDGIHFLDAAEGWMVHSSTIYHSLDGGLNWTRQSIDWAMNTAVQFLDAAHAYACGGCGGLWYTDDGSNWDLLENSIAEDVNDLFFLDVCRGWFVGKDGLLVRIDCPGGNNAPYLPLCSSQTYAMVPVAVMNTPAGDGTPLTAAHTFGEAGTVDATVVVVLKNVADEPVAGYPAVKIQLASEAGGLIPCTGGATADGPTDALGIATFTGTLAAGGYSDHAGGEQAVVVIDGRVLPGSEMDIFFHSPDLNGDLVVDCHDDDIFETDFFDYDFRSDFYWDQLVNVLDLAIFVGYSGQSCAYVPDPNRSTVATAASGWASLFNIPDGSGDDLSNCFAPGGDRVDATLSVTLRNSADVPIAGIPATDLRLTFATGNVVSCGGDINADAATDASGVTTFTGPYQLGGWTEGPVGVALSVNGCEYHLGDVQLKFNSLDITGDTYVKKADEDSFGIDFLPLTPYNYRSDFDFDGYVQVDDQAEFVGYVPSGCTGSLADVPPRAVSLLRDIRPNPFNPQTTVVLALERTTRVLLAAYDARGRKVRTLVADRELVAGSHEIVWNGCDDAGRHLPSGTYFLRLTGGFGAENRKVSLIR